MALSYVHVKSPVEEGGVADGTAVTSGRRVHLPHVPPKAAPLRKRLSTEQTHGVAIDAPLHLVLHKPIELEVTYRKHRQCQLTWEEKVN